MGTSFAGEKLKKLRQDMGWSQVDLADRIGVSGSMVSMYEGGQRMPARDTLAKIAKELNTSMDELVLHVDDIGIRIRPSNPLKDEEVDFGFSISRSRGKGDSVTLLFDKKKPVLKVNGDERDFAELYARLQPEDKIAVCKEMLDRAKDELIGG